MLAILLGCLLRRLRLASRYSLLLSGSFSQVLFLFRDQESKPRAIHVWGPSANSRGVSAEPVDVSGISCRSTAAALRPAGLRAALGAIGSQDDRWRRRTQREVIFHPDGPRNSGHTGQSGGGCRGETRFLLGPSGSSEWSDEPSRSFRSHASTPTEPLYFAAPDIVNRLLTLLGTKPEINPQLRSAFPYSSRSVSLPRTPTRQRRTSR